MNQGMETYMSSRLYKAAAAGDVDYLTSDTVFEEINVDSDTATEERNERLRRHLLCLTHEETNCLHVAARFGRENFVRRVLSLCPSLLYHPNSRGDNPLHVAARVGHLGVVELLINSFQHHQCTRSSRSTESAENNESTGGEGNQENSTNFTDSVQPPRTSAGDNIISDESVRQAEEGERPSHPVWGTQSQQINGDSIHLSQSSQSESSTGDLVTRIASSEWPSLPIWRTQNHDGSTALHEALRGKHKKVALHLLDLPSELVVLIVNAKGESPLYLAAEAGFKDASVKILQILGEGGRNNAVGPMGQTALHAAVLSPNAEIIKVLHKSIPGLIRKRDSFGKTALHYAAQSNNIRIIRLLLELDASCAYICDNEGFSPLLVAASMGNSESVRAILDACPASIESSNDRGHNALHLAVKYNSNVTTEKLLQMPEIRALINEPDKEGNTPLHLAAMNCQPWTVNALLSTEGVDMTAKNNVGETALDLCAFNTEPFPIHRQSATKFKLKRKKAPRGRVRPLMRNPYSDPNSNRTRVEDRELTQMVNTQAVVAALLVTITFAAAFTTPGGLKADGSGSPSLIDKPALIIFCLSDTISFACSMAALTILLSVTVLSEKASSKIKIYYGTLLVSCALIAAVIAFISGFYATVSIEVPWVAILICIIGSSSYLLAEWVNFAGYRLSSLIPVANDENNTRPIIGEEMAYE